MTETINETYHLLQVLWRHKSQRQPAALSIVKNTPFYQQHNPAKPTSNKHLEQVFHNCTESVF